MITLNNCDPKCPWMKGYSEEAKMGVCQFAHVKPFHIVDKDQKCLYNYEGHPLDIPLGEEPENLRPRIS